jgi:hypothetical protein
MADKQLRHEIVTVEVEVDDDIIQHMTSGTCGAPTAEPCGLQEIVMMRVYLGICESEKIRTGVFD